jgi:glycosyltransferase involved in cell wall biosynthesis
VFAETGSTFNFRLKSVYESGSFVESTERTDNPASSVARLAVLIPARRSTPALTPLVDALMDAGFGAVIVVDDGSPAGDQAAFAALDGKQRVHLIRHAFNLGKGRALKTGINFFLKAFPEFLGLITADADGQHTASDIVRVGEALVGHPERAVLGARSFAGEVPLRSQFGNALTRLLFRIASGSAMKDTQSGLRGFPTALLAGLAELGGERYEYEMNVLAHLCRHGHAPLEVPISTIYLDENRSSHFEPVRDSMRIGLVLLGNFASSLRAEE